MCTFTLSKHKNSKNMAEKTDQKIKVDYNAEWDLKFPGFEDLDTCGDYHLDDHPIKVNNYFLHCNISWHYKIHHDLGTDWAPEHYTANFSSIHVFVDSVWDLEGCPAEITDHKEAIFADEVEKVLRENSHPSL